jgi:Ca2+:H+ antiporter
MKIKMWKSYVFMLIAFGSIFLNISSSLVNTIIYCAAIVPLAVLLGEHTTNMSEYIGEKKGGLLAATIGNFPELVMGIWSIRYGMILMAKAALMGSIISNMLIGLGISVIFGGLKYKEQKFNKIIARTNFNMLLLALSSMVVMASINRYGVLKSNEKINISAKVAVVLVTIYILGLIFSLWTHRNHFIITEDSEEKSVEFRKEFLIIVLNLISISALLYFVSEKLIFNIKIFVSDYKISEKFLGIILIPLLGNIGENASAIMSAMKNKVNLSLETAIGSSIQISLFVTPLIIIFGYFMGIQINLVFDTFQIIMTSIAVGMSYFVFQDGRTYWFEGAILIAIYLMITLAYYYIA